MRRFFGAEGADYEWLFGLHALEHKACGGRADFDGLRCDGSANHAKLFQGGGDVGWRVAGDLKDGFKARSFPRAAKEAIIDWVLLAYVMDIYVPPPLTEATDLMGYREAGQVARNALRLLAEEPVTGHGDADPRQDVYFPLGLERHRVKVCRALKASAFLFRTPRQRRRWVRAMAMFGDETGCGLELLALRRTSGDRRQGSLADFAEVVYRLIRDGRLSPPRDLNLARMCGEVRVVARNYRQLIAELKADANAKLLREIAAARLPEEATLTGLFVGTEDLFRFV